MTKAVKSKRTQTTTSKSKSKTKPLTKQQMFDRAVIGLRSQGWKPGLDTDGSCVYFASRPLGILRCAWGWVDPQNTLHQSGTVISLYERGRGIAATLTDKRLDFAQLLQKTHDNNSCTPSELAEAFKVVGRKHRLKWPSKRRKVTWIKPGEAGTKAGPRA